MIGADFIEPTREETVLTVKLVTASVAGQLVGIPIDRVRDVFVVQAPTSVPLAPQEVAGLVNLRGKVVTVLSMRRIMGFAVDAEGELAIGIEADGELYGLLVDEVGDVIDLPSTAIDRNPPHLDWRWAAISTGIRRWNDRLLIEIDTPALLKRPAAA